MSSIRMAIQKISGLSNKSFTGYSTLSPTTQGPLSLGIENKKVIWGPHLDYKGFPCSIQVVK